MKHTSRNLTILLAILISFALYSSSTLFDERALAQSGGAKETSNPKGSGEPSKNPDGSTTTTKPNDTYARGGTKETTVDKDGKTVTKEVWRDKNGKPVRAKDGSDEIEWKYDDRGRLVRVLIKYPRGGRIRILKEYKDADDSTGTTDVTSYSTENDEYTTLDGLAAAIILGRLASFAPRVVTYSFVGLPKEEKKEPPKEDSPKQETPKQSAPNIIPTALENAANEQPVALAQGKPVLIFTIDGKEVARIVAPPGANDLRIIWGVLTPYGYWTKNGQEIKGSRFQIPPGVNDFHFSPNGRFTPVPPIAPPQGANDIEFRWEGDRIVEAWWTKDGQRMSRIPLSGDTQEFNFQLNPEKRQETAQATATTQLVGLVYDRDSRPGDQVTVSLTTDPKKYENIPALGVIEMKVPANSGATVQSTLQGLVIDLGDGRQQPASQPLTIQIAQNSPSVPVRVSQQGNSRPVAQSSMPITQGQSNITVANTGKPSDFTTPPLAQTMSVIHGPLSGDGNATRIAVDNQRASVVTETPRSVYFDLPTNTPVGSHTLTLEDNGRNAQFPIVNMSLLMQADQLTLQRGQSTNYNATIRLGQTPDSVWQSGGGASPELTNVSRIQALAPNFHIPQAGEPGVILLRIENASRDTVSIRPSQNEVVTRVLHKDDFQNNQFTVSGVIQSKKSGGFVLNGLAEAFFAPIPGQEVRGGVIARHTVPGKVGFCSGTCKTRLIAQSGFDEVVSCPGPIAGTEACPKNCSCHLLRAKKANPDDDWEEVPKPASGKPIYDSDYEYYCHCAP